MKYEFIRMPDSTGFGDYTESGQVIPVSLNGRRGSYTHCMFLDDEAADRRRPRALGLPQEAGEPEPQGREGHAGRHARLRLGARGHRHDGLQAPHADTRRRSRLAMRSPNFLIKIIPHVDGTPRICELVEYHLEDIELRAPGRARLAAAYLARAGACRRAAGARGRLGRPLRRRPDPRPRQGRARLPAPGCDAQG